MTIENTEFEYLVGRDRGFADGYLAGHEVFPGVRHLDPGMKSCVLDIIVTQHADDCASDTLSFYEGYRAGFNQGFHPGMDDAEAEASPRRTTCNRHHP